MDELQKALKKGATIINETDDYVTVEFKKSFNWFAFLILFLFGVILGILYLLYYAGKQPERKTITKEKKK